MFKQSVVLLLGLSLTICLAGCGSSQGATASTAAEASTSAETATSVDDQFIAAVQKGLEARYAMGDSSTTAGTDEYLEDLSNRVNAEYDAAANYSDSTFEDATLGQEASDYIASLAEMQSLIKTAKNDPAGFANAWPTPYDKRAKCLLSFVNDYGLTISGQYQAQFDDVLNDAKTQATHTDEFTITNVTKGEDNGYGYYELDVTVQNNADGAKNFLGFSVKELDANGNILKSYKSYNKNASYAVVEPGQQYHIQLTEASADNIAGFESDGYEYGESTISPVEGTFSTPYKVMF
jgi:hypothetical protein